MPTASSLVWARRCMPFDKLVRLPAECVVVAKTVNSEFAAIAHQTKPIFGVQFHPELEHTPRGTETLRNFSVVIYGLIDNRLMRLNECDEVKATLQEHLDMNLTVVDRSKLFLSRLKGIKEPEKERAI
ncbi:hypothetical protein E4U41_006576 [Claviceps citrina]|nr:hypothetical protein E4U41_006576 [Claviceps citrina]